MLAMELLKVHGMPRVTEHTLETVTALKAELEKTRERGYAIDDQESMLGAYCVAAPILDSNEHPIAAMSIAAPNVRLNRAHAGEVSAVLLEAAAAIADKLSGAPPQPAKAAIRASAGKSTLIKSNSICS